MHPYSRPIFNQRGIPPRMPRFCNPDNFRRPLPNKIEEHWCETCDKSFPTVNLLEKHKQEHQKCNIDGCQFVAHPKVITKHIQMQHSTGLYKKISKLNDPDEVKKWLEERKKRYPTKQNIDKKAAELKEKIDRGEKIGLINRPPRERKDVNTRNSTKISRDFQSRHKQHLPPPRSHVQTPRKEKPMLHFEYKRKLKPFGGIGDLIMDIDEDENVESCQNNNILIEDDDFAEETVTLLKESKQNSPVVCGALSSLVSNYGCSDEDSDFESKVCNDSDTTPLKKCHIQEIPKENTSKSVVSNNCIEGNKSDGDDSGPEEIKLDKSHKIEPSSMVIHKDRVISKHIKAAHKPPSRMFQRPKPKPPSTLLQKLLFKEMRKERNMVMQCIRYIVKNKYFETKKEN